jgi:hypothetical protein
VERNEYLPYNDQWFEGSKDGKISEHENTTFKALENILYSSIECQARDKPEFSWCCRVILPLLDLAAQLENTLCEENDRKVRVEEVYVNRHFFLFRPILLQILINLTALIPVFLRNTLSRPGYAKHL